MSTDLPIEPGSPLDYALDSCARHVALNHPFNLDAWKMITMSRNGAHMLAFGTRVWLMKAGVTEPRNLVTSIHDQWYGQADNGVTN
jgi:hypothetical protein